MDVRHESFDQEVFNQLITIINKYLTENIDGILNYPPALNLIKEVTKTIFNDLHMDIDVDEIVAKKNLLSIDVVVFPHIDDLLKGDIDTHSIKEVKSIIHHHLNDSKNLVNENLCQDLLNIFEVHQI